TTLAVSLASALSRQAKVLVLDADPQESVLQWADQCNGFAFDVQSFDLAQERIPSSGYDYVIIDFPPGFTDEEFDRHLAQLTQILVPVNASPLDLWATVSFASLLDASAKEQGDVSAKFFGVQSN
ncbi:MAG: ParA family protein, partial [Thiotrichales bacterium]